MAATVQTECLPMLVTQSKYEKALLETTSLIKLEVINVPPIRKILAQLLADEINSHTHPTHLQVERVVVKIKKFIQNLLYPLYTLEKVVKCP